MNRQMTFRQYRAVDLVLFALMLCLSETVIVTAATLWFPDQLYTVSVTGAITAIVLMRWGPFAAIHAVLGGLVYCFAAHGTAAQFVVYCLGNLLSLLSLGFLRLFGGERIRNGAFLSVGFGLFTLLSMQLGRALVALAMGTAARSCLGFFTTDMLSFLFTGVIIWIARRLDGIFENQKHYLLRIHAEEEKGGYR